MAYAPVILVSFWCYMILVVRAYALPVIQCYLQNPWLFMPGGTASFQKVGPFLWNSRSSLHGFKCGLTALLYNEHYKCWMYSFVLWGCYLCTQPCLCNALMSCIVWDIGAINTVIILLLYNCLHSALCVWTNHSLAAPYVLSTTCDLSTNICNQTANIHIK